MKTLINTLILALLLIGGSSLRAQNGSAEYLGLPGDNLNLFAVMKIFQESETLESLERSLNDSEQMVNNLDLNNDNFVDYIMVFDYVEGDIHSIVLRVALNDREYQDVAVFTVEKTGNGSVQIQLIGDEALYGPNYIIEPYYAETPNPGYMGEGLPQSQSVVSTTYYEVANWPVIIYMYRPTYRVWRSAWYWGYYPSYWSPWTPHYWHYYYGYHSHWDDYYYAYYRPCRTYRSNHYQNVYYGRIRNYSPTVVININNRIYNNTYSRPEKRLDGEKLFARKHPDARNDFKRERSRTDSQNDITTGRRPVNEDTRTEMNTVTRQRMDTRDKRENTTRPNDAAKPNRVKRPSETTSSRPQRVETAKPERTKSVPDRNRETAKPKRERPASSVNRPSSGREKPAGRTKPTVTPKRSESSKKESKSTTKSSSKSEKSDRGRSKR